MPLTGYDKQGSLPEQRLIRKKFKSFQLDGNVVKRDGTALDLNGKFLHLINVTKNVS